MVIGQHEDGVAGRRPGDRRRPAVERGADAPAVPGGDVDEPQARGLGLSGVPNEIRMQATERPSGEMAGAAYRASPSVSSRRSPVARSMTMRSWRTGCVARSQRGDHERAVVGQVELGLDHRFLRRAGQVARVGQRLGRRARRGRREQVQVSRPQVVVPVADREALEEQRADAGILAGLLDGLVGGEVGGPGMEGHGEDDVAARAGGGDTGHPGLRRQQQPRLAALGGQQPESGRRLVLGLVRLGIGIRPRRGEEQRAVGQEGGPALAGRRARQAAWRPGPGQVEAPDGALEGLALGVEHRDADGQP